MLWQEWQQYHQQRQHLTHLSATDNDIYISEEVEFIDIRETGTALIPCKRFFNIVKDIRGDEITITVKNGKAAISSGKSKFSITLFDGDIIEPEVKGKDKTYIDADEMLNAIVKTQYSASKESDRFIMSGICINNGDFAATDTFRMSLYKTGSDITGGVIPATSLMKVRESLTGKIICINSDSHVKLVSDRSTIYLRKIDGKYPAYENIIPDNKISIKVKRDEFRHGIKQASNTLDPGTNSIKLSFTDHLEITFGGCDSSIVVPCESSENIDISFNYTYLVDILNNLDGEEIELLVKDGTTPAIISEGLLTYVISPVCS
jgi:DNA polymerase-3 subunit beta